MCKKSWRTEKIVPARETNCFNNKCETNIYAIDGRAVEALSSWPTGLNCSIWTLWDAKRSNDRMWERESNNNTWINKYLKQNECFRSMYWMFGWNKQTIFKKKEILFFCWEIPFAFDNRANDESIKHKIIYICMRI